LETLPALISRAIGFTDEWQHFLYVIAGFDLATPLS
jgi:hypothetical protein